MPATDPEHYRMTLGQHLDELRSRLIKALIGLVLAFAACLVFSQSYTIPYFCKPLLDVLYDYEINPQLYATGAGDAFVVYIKISLISGAVIASPWIIWQAWQFIAAGLYPSERKTVTRYVPLSIILTLTGVAFVYFMVLPWTLHFFIAFAGSIKLPEQYAPSPVEIDQPLPRLVALEGDPINPGPLEYWYNLREHRMKVFVNGEVRVVQLLPTHLVSPLITLPGYINLVLMMLVTFAGSFQLPLVVMAVVRLGIFRVDDLKRMRKMVYFVMVIAAAVITPGDVITATIALMFPLIGLYELGLWLARERPADEAT